MRVLVPTTWFPTESHPGKAVFVRRHVEAIASRHDVTVVHLCPAGQETVSVPGVRTITVPLDRARPASLVAAARRLRSLRRDLDADIVHTMGFSSLAIVPVAGFGRPWVHTDHWTGLVDPASAGQLWRRGSAARHLLRLPDQVTVVSSWMAEQLAPYVRTGRCHVVPNVVSCPSDARPWPTGQPLRLLGVGALIGRKGPDLAVRTVQALAARGVEAHLRWVGDGPLRSEVHDLAGRLGIAERVTLTGPVPPAEVWDHIDWSTLMLLPTELETFCVAAAESIMAGRPAVLGATGGQRDFISEANGVLVPERTPERFADAVVAVVERMAQSSPAEVAATLADRFRPAAVADAFDEVYAIALGQRPGQPRREVGTGPLSQGQVEGGLS